MKMFTVEIKVSNQNTGKRYLITSLVMAKHEMVARAVAFVNLADDYLIDVNVLTVDINENLDGFHCVSMRDLTT